VSKSNAKSRSKSVQTSAEVITIVGCGKVGASIALLLLQQKKAGRIINIMEPMAGRQGHIMELLHCQVMHPDTVIKINDTNCFSESNVIIHTAGIMQKIIGSRMEVARGNIEMAVQIYRDVVFSNDPVMIVVSNPVDVISYFISQYAQIPSNRIIGTGTLIDSFRMAANIAKYFGVNGSEVSAMVIGEHGETMVPVFSSVLVRNKPLGKQYLKDARFIQEIRTETIFAARNIKRTQSATYLGIADATVFLLDKLNSSAECILPASVMLPIGIKERLNISEDLFLSFPLKISGGNWTIQLPELEESEWSQLRVSAIYLEGVVNGLQGKSFAAE